MTTYTVLLLEKNSVQINELAPGTAYLFRVQALSSDNNPGGSTMEEQFETLIEGKYGGKTKKRVVCEMFMNGLFLTCSSVFFFFLCFSEHSQNNIAAILGAAVGGAAMLLIVVVVLLLCRRSVIMFP